jgi:phosphoglycolate phosphatase
MSAIRLVLFDVDGTLILGAPGLRRWFEEALVEVFGQAGDIDGHSFSGKIDPQIVHELLSGAGLTTHEIEAGLPAVKEGYLSRLKRHLRPRDLRLLPHVLETLERLDSRQDLVLGLLTGNWEVGARTKLACFDLNRFFAFGAFSDGQSRRRDLPPIALRHAAAVTGERFEPAETLIVGDSVLDVECARQSGMRCLAVATGYTPLSDLGEAGPDWVVGDLGEAAEVHPLFRG